MPEENLGGSTPPPEAQSVPLDEASNEDIEAFLSNYREEPYTSEDTEEVTTDKHSAPVAPTQEQANKTSTEPTGPVSRKEHEQVIAKNEQLRAALEKQSLAWQRRSTEIGELRRALREANEKLAQGLNDDFLENPERAVDRKLQIRTNEQHLQQLDQEEAGLNSRTQSIHTVANYVPEEEFDVSAMASALQRDGVAPQVIQQFVTDPYSQTNGVTLVQLAKRAHAEKLLTHVYQYARNLEQQIQELKNKPEQVLKNIERTTQARPMTAANGGSAQRSLSDASVRVDQMSDAELDELIRKFR